MKKWLIIKNRSASADISDIYCIFQGNLSFQFGYRYGFYIPYCWYDYLAN